MKVSIHSTPDSAYRSGTAEQSKPIPPGIRKEIKVGPSKNTKASANRFRTDICILRITDLVRYIGLSKSSIANMRNPKSKYYDADFPHSIPLSGRAVGFFKADIDAYLDLKRVQSQKRTFENTSDEH